MDPAASKLILLLFSCALLNSAPEPDLPAPGLPAPTVVRAADHLAGPVSPGEIVILYHSNPGPDILAGTSLDASGKVLTTLGDTRVLFDDLPAPLAYSVTGDVMAVVPYEVSSKKTTQVVVEYQGKRSAPASVPVVESAPALFTLDSTGRGQAAMLNETGCCNSVLNPAMRGTVAVLYATGEGQTKPSGITGSVTFHEDTTAYPIPRLPVRVTIGGRPAEIVWAAEAPHAVAGLFQINFRVPANAPVGNAVPITLSLGSFHSPDGVTMAVRSQVRRVLVADPDATVRSRLASVLTAAHYYVSTASNAREALEQVQGNLYPVDLVVFSLAIPEQERVNAIHALRAELPQLKIIATATTPSLDASTLRDADLIGAQAVLAHPLSSQVLLQRVRALLTPHPTPYTDVKQPPSVPGQRSAR